MSTVRTQPRCLPRPPWLLWLTLLWLAPQVAAAQADPELLGALQDPSFKVRLRAALVIGKKKLKDAAPALRKALDDEQDAVRAAAASSLGQVGDQDSRPLLVRLLNHTSEAVRKSATKGLVALDGELGGGRKYLLVYDAPVLPTGVGAGQGTKLLRVVKKELGRSPLAVPSVGEENVLQGTALTEHLGARGLVGLKVQTKLVKLLATQSGVVCKVSIMLVTVPGNRLEFAGNGEGEAEADGELDDDTRVEVEDQLLDAAGQAAAQEVAGYLTRRTGP
jgi:hypothetical protein